MPDQVLVSILQRGALRRAEQRHPRSQVSNSWTAAGLCPQQRPVRRPPCGKETARVKREEPLLAHEPNDGLGWHQTPTPRPAPRPGKGSELVTPTSRPLSRPEGALGRDVVGAVGDKWALEQQGSQGLPPGQHLSLRLPGPLAKARWLGHVQLQRPEVWGDPTLRTCGRRNTATFSAGQSGSHCCCCWGLVQPGPWPLPGPSWVPACASPPWGEGRLGRDGAPAEPAGP